MPATGGISAAFFAAYNHLRLAASAFHGGLFQSV
ncbi:MAG: hypothetical protein ACJAY2_003296 [Pseudomonadales bacterium]|jgi:hypothetical protein